MNLVGLSYNKSKIKDRVKKELQLNTVFCLKVNQNKLLVELNQE